jgi:hypothetical protein
MVKWLRVILIDNMSKNLRTCSCYFFLFVYFLFFVFCLFFCAFRPLSSLFFLFYAEFSCFCFRSFFAFPLFFFLSFFSFFSSSPAFPFPPFDYYLPPIPQIFPKSCTPCCILFLCLPTEKNHDYFLLFSQMTRTICKVQNCRLF